MEGRKQHPVTLPRDLRAALSAREQLAEVNAPKVRCGSHAEEWDGRINRCVLSDDHLGYHTDGCLLWSDLTQAWDCGDAAR